MASEVAPARSQPLPVSGRRSLFPNFLFEESATGSSGVLAFFLRGEKQDSYHCNRQGVRFATFGRSVKGRAPKLQLGSIRRTHDTCQVDKRILLMRTYSSHVHDPHRRLFLNTLHCRLTVNCDSSETSSNAMRRLRRDGTHPMVPLWSGNSGRFFYFATNFWRSVTVRSVRSTKGHPSLGLLCSADTSSCARGNNSSACTI